MRCGQRYLIFGLAMMTAPLGLVGTAGPAGADCTSAGGSSVCAQGDVRGVDGMPRVATPVVPYPCEYDWYCDTGDDLDIVWAPGPTPPIDIGRPGRPGGGGGIGGR